MKSGSCMTLPSMPDKHALCLTQPPLHPHKIMLCIWLTSKQVMHYELLPTDQTITVYLYWQQLEHWTLKQKEPALVNQKSLLFLHVNARPCVVQVARDNIQQCVIHLTPWTFHQRITTSSILWTTTFMGNPLQMWQRDFFVSKKPDFYHLGIVLLKAHW